MSNTRANKRIEYDLDWNLLRTFMVIVQTGGITSASEKLHVTQPTVSLALKRLEDRLGYRLIERGQGNFHVTERGETLYNEVINIFASISRFDVLVNDTPGGLFGHIRILIASRVEPPILDGAIHDFSHKNRMVTFSIEVMSSHDILLAIQNKVAAIGICLLPRPVRSINQEVILKQRYRFYCGRNSRLFGRSGLELSDLKSQDFVSFTSDQFEGALSPLALFRAQEGFTGRVVGTSASVDEVRRMIRAGVGIGPLAEHLAQPDVEAGILWPLPPAEGVGTIDCYVIWNPLVRLSRAEKAFLERLLVLNRQVREEERIPLQV